MYNRLGLQQEKNTLFNELTLHDNVSANAYVTRRTWTVTGRFCSHVFRTRLSLFCPSVAGGWPNLAQELRYGQVQCTHVAWWSNNFIMLQRCFHLISVTLLCAWIWDFPIRCPDLEIDKWRKCYITSGKKFKKWPNWKRGVSRLI